jgi:hypothetical protein
MWIAINNHVLDAIDSNMDTIKAVSEALEEADFPLAALARITIRGIEHRANALDTDLRSLTMALMPAVEKEKENNKL